MSLAVHDHLESPAPCAARIRTTLYDLVEAVMDEVGPEEHDIVTNVVVNLLDRAVSPRCMH
ncbi:MAG: hypothetical protein JXL84_25720 [Deltaproteobacteria bacterium]|nr:hypothetical protein [Deltaproteobacteria bacterium]